MNLKAYFIEKPVVEKKDGRVVRVIRAPQAFPYEPTVHPVLARKFLYWRDDNGALLLVGNDALHQDMAQSAHDAGVAVPSSLPLGAGNLFILEDGIETEEQMRRYLAKHPMTTLRPYVSQWSSVGYNVRTPRGLRPTLKAMISPEAIETNPAAAELDDAERAAKFAEDVAEEDFEDDMPYDTY